MSSSKARDDAATGRGLGQLAFDPEAVLVREPGLLLDPRFVAALRAELTEELGARDGATALHQIGCLHGLRDAAQVVSATFAAPSAHATTPSAPALPIRFRMESARSADALELSGTWPECAEASAWLSRHAVAESPVCALSAGYTSGWLSGILDADVVVLETRCCAAGAERCSFVAGDAASWRASGHPLGAGLAEVLPFEALRRAVAHGPSHEQPPAAGALGTRDAVIQIWGPVMVIPYSGVDEALMAVNLVSQDPAVGQVSVILIDLTGAVVDEAFGAVTLEQIIDSVEACGAEAVFAGVSSLSAPVVAGLQRQPILVCKDLHAGIAASFQIADSQQRLL